MTDEERAKLLLEITLTALILLRECRELLKEIREKKRKPRRNRQKPRKRKR